nr:GTPase domain-containing protein [Pseudomonadota bacterium]
MFKHSYASAKDANFDSDIKLVSLLGVVSKMEEETFATKDQEVVLVIGSTGAGKSTFINYVSGRKMILDTSQMDDAVKCKDALAPIGHGMKSCTDRPQLYKEPQSGLILSDCPGFFDNRGINVEIANAVGIQSMAKNSKRVKGIVLIIERSSFTSSRGQGLEMALQSTLEFLGPELSKHLGSIMLLISKVPNDKVAITYKTIAEESERFPLCSELLRMGNVGFYSPLDDLHAGPGVLTQRDLLSKIMGLKGIANSERTFNITISPSAKLEVTGLISLISTRIRNHLAKQEFEPLPQLVKLTETLTRLNIERVNDEVEKMESMVIDQIKLFEFQDKGVEQLNKLKKLMPAPYQPAIEQTLQ